MFFHFVEEFLVVIDFCQFGNLKSYLTGHRDEFVNQLNASGDMTIPVNKTAQMNTTRNSGQDINNANMLNENILKTSNLISWSLQIARGMEFLASKKVTDAIGQYFK